MGNSLLETLLGFFMIEGIRPCQATIEPYLSFLAVGDYFATEFAQIVVRLASWTFLDSGEVHLESGDEPPERT